MDEIELALLFSANRAYFLVDMEVPVGVRRLSCARCCPTRRAAELYTMVGLQKAGKKLFFRDFLHHLKHSRDNFIVAPGIKGLVMTRVHAAVVPVRVQGDPGPDRAVEGHRPREGARQKYALVKHHDRVGRMADILEYSDVAFPRDALLGRAARRAAQRSPRRRSRTTATASSCSISTSSGG